VMAPFSQKGVSYGLGTIKQFIRDNSDTLVEIEFAPGVVGRVPVKRLKATEPATPRRRKSREVWAVEQSRENKVSRIARDLSELAKSQEITESLVHKALLHHGAYKAFALRLDLFHQDAAWRERVIQIHAALHVAKEEARQTWKPWADLSKEERKAAIRRRRDIQKLRGELRAFQAIRGQAREILRSPKWRAATNDTAAQRFLMSLVPEEQKTPTG